MKTDWSSDGTPEGRTFAGWRQRLRRQCGVTLIEMLIATFILSSVSFAALKFYKNSHGQYLQQADLTDTQQNLRAVMDELTRQIRTAGYRVFGAAAVEVMGNSDWLLLRYHDGTGVRTKIFYPYQNPVSGRTDLMMMLNGAGATTFAEGIDSVRFTAGGTGAGTDWITVELVARTAREGFQSDQTSGTTDSHGYLYRRLSSRVNLRNR